MVNSEAPYVVIVGVDYTPVTELAFAAAYDLASQAPSGELHAVHLVTPPWPALAGEPQTPSVEEVVARAKARLASYVAERVAALDSKPSSGRRAVRTVTHVRTDELDNEIASLASDLEADVVVVGCHGRGGFPRLVLGPVAEAAVRWCPCPVLVVRPKATPGTVLKLRAPCPECLAVRGATSRSEFWCSTHRPRDGQRDARTVVSSKPGLSVEL